MQIKSIFNTLAGEGANAGTPAIFIRMSSCNVWSGKFEDRKRDAERNHAPCALFCDTDFRGGDTMDVSSIVNTVLECGGKDIPLIVLTGGEPLLQISPPLLTQLKKFCKHAKLAIETNGTRVPTPEVYKLLDWVCVSPKVPVDELALVAGDELKVVFPSYNPRDYTTIMGGFTHCYVSPQATPGNRSIIIQDNTDRAARFVMENPKWKLSLQTHKIIGLP